MKNNRLLTVFIVTYAFSIFFITALSAQPEDSLTTGNRFIVFYSGNLLGEIEACG